MNYHRTSTIIAQTLSERCGIALYGRFGRMAMTQVALGLDWSKPNPEAHEQRQS